MSDKEQVVKMLQELIQDVESGKVVIDDYCQKNDHAEITKPRDVWRNHMLTGVSHVSFRLQNPEQMKKHQKWIKDNGLTEHYA